jgi:hypothetical protein
MPNEFPKYTRKGNVAHIPLYAANGYRHVLKVPADGSEDIAANALSFLQSQWPFIVTKGGKRKKVIRPDGMYLHDLWLNQIWSKSSVPVQAYCRNHDWLDWTDLNIFAEWRARRDQLTFEAQTSFQRSLITDAGADILAARAAYGAKTYVSKDPEIARIFEEAQNVPVHRTRPPGYDPDGYPEGYLDGKE